MPLAARIQLSLNLLMLWRALCALAGLALSGGVLAGAWLPQLPLAGRILVGVLSGVGGLASAGAGLWLWRRTQRGRLLSLAIDYLLLVACVVSVLHLTGVFLALDALADNFANGLPFLGLLLVGYLIHSAGDRYADNPHRERRLRQVGGWVMALAFVLTLVALGLLNGLLVWFGRLLDPGVLGVLGGAVLAGSALWLAWQPRLAQALGERASHAELINGYLFLSPNLLGFLAFFAGPLLISLYLSFTNSDAVSPPQWIGAQNYIDILGLTLVPLTSADQLAREALDINRYSELTRFALGNQFYLLGATDKLFWVALGNTLTFVVLAVPLSVIPALLLANLLNTNLPGMKFFRAIYFIPSVAAVVGISLIWQLLYNASVGYINYGIASSIDLLNQIFGFTLANPNIRWLSDSRTALLAMVIVSAWQTMGFNTVLFLAGLQNVPTALYEAATVDGAGAWAKFWNVTLPMLAPTTFFVVTTTTIQAMQVFEQVFILMNPPEGPNNATLTIVLYLYRNGFQNFRQGYGAALAWLVFVLIFGLTLFQFQRQRHSSAYEG